MSDEEKEFIKKINVDKAKNKTVVPIVLIAFSISTYILPLINGEFDFGIIFEVASLVFLILARINMSKYDEIKAKRYIICSMVSIGWILIYDILVSISYVEDIVDVIFLPWDFVLAQVISLAYLILLFAINKDLSKADNPVKYKESTDWFYEQYEEDKK